LTGDFEAMKREDETIDEAMSAVMGWQKALEYLDEEIPETFPLKDLWDEHAARRGTVKTDFEHRRRSGQ
jgi:hypothetical protein